MQATAIEVSPVNPATGERVTLRFCDADDERLTAWNGEVFWPGIMRNLALNREGWNGDWQVGIALAQAALDVSTTALRLADPASPVYRWAGAPMVVYSGERGATLDLLFEGRVLSHTIEGDDLRLTAQVDSEPFEGQSLPLFYDGSGLDGGGDEGLREFPKPACFGFCRNVEPVHINRVDNVFQVHGYGSIESIDALFERARDFGPPLADYPTYDALLEAQIYEGSWATCLAQGMFRLGAPPYGVITVDVRGDNVGGFHQSTAAIITRLCEIAGVEIARLDTDSLDAFEAAVPFPVNLYLTQQEVLIDVLMRIAAPCNASAGLSWDGRLQVTRFGSLPAPTIMLDAQTAQRPAVLKSEELATFVPWWRLEMTAERNWRPMSQDEIAFDELFGAEVPMRVYRRWPVKPDTPTEMANVPQGWTSLRPARIFGQDYTVYTGFLDPDTGLELLTDVYLSIGFLDLTGDYFNPYAGLAPVGPIWMSEAKQVGGVVQGEWSEPTLADPQYAGWSIWPVTAWGDPYPDNDGTDEHSTGAHVRAPREWIPNRGKAGTDSVEAGASGVEPGEESTFVIDRVINGPFELSFTVPSGATQFFAGVMEYDPFDILFEDPDAFDVALGFYVPQDDTYWLEGDDLGGGLGFEPVNGIFPFEQYQPDGGYNDDLSYGFQLDRPPDYSNYRLVFDGQAYWLYVNNTLARTFDYDPTYMGGYDWSLGLGGRYGHWAIFAISTPGGEITNIRWKAIPQERRFDYDIVETYGPMRYLENEKKWENLQDPVRVAGQSIYGVMSYFQSEPMETIRFEFRPGFNFVGGSANTYTQCFLSRSFATSGIFEIGFEFAANGTYRIYGAAGALSTDVSAYPGTGTYSYVPGVDRFSLEWDGRYLYFKKNGQPIQLQSYRTFSWGGYLMRLPSTSSDGRKGRMRYEAGAMFFPWFELGGNGYLADVTIDGPASSSANEWRDEVETTTFPATQTKAQETETWLSASIQVIAETPDITVVGSLYENRTGGTSNSTAVLVGMQADFEMVSGGGVWRPAYYLLGSKNGGASWSNIPYETLEPYGDPFTRDDLSLTDPDNPSRVRLSIRSVYPVLNAGDVGGSFRARFVMRDTTFGGDSVVEITNGRLAITLGS